MFLLIFDVKTVLVDVTRRPGAIASNLALGVCLANCGCDMQACLHEHEHLFCIASR